MMEQSNSMSSASVIKVRRAHINTLRREGVQLSHGTSPSRAVLTCGCASNLDALYSNRQADKPQIRLPPGLKCMGLELSECCSCCT